MGSTTPKDALKPLLGACFADHTETLIKIPQSVPEQTAFQPQFSAVSFPSISEAARGMMTSAIGEYLIIPAAKNTPSVLHKRHKGKRHIFFTPITGISPIIPVNKRIWKEMIAYIPSANKKPPTSLPQPSGKISSEYKNAPPPIPITIPAKIPIKQKMIKSFRLILSKSFITVL